MVKIRLMGAMAHLAGAKEVNIKIEEPKTVDEILREVIREYDRLHNKIIFVNGKVARGDTIVHDSDEIKVMPVLSGG
ncbi:MAG TPA: MoaD/ThiS family protein [Thermococcus paralvinellae]|uniref:MoaD/ThiS family protein n=1 Tax=Thermococcus paralvinellae TaxID=582419 RepID=A0A832Z9Y5_9EURY|nr:MoaD/ThiS family protein [Thermococcus paralvinellae]HIP89045.1 MoaD/ThiS family protein [Thermococcus paralvinellae]